MNTVQYLDAIREKLRLSNDSEIARRLAIGPQAICNYRAGLSYFRDDVAVRAAQLLGIEPAIVVLDAQIERTKSPEVKAALTRFMEKFSTSFETLLRYQDPRCVRLAA